MLRPHYIKGLKTVLKDISETFFKFSYSIILYSLFLITSIGMQKAIGSLNYQILASSKHIIVSKPLSNNR